ncbi:MAG: molybdopterin-dependent oxidoreductase [Gammaproteobacteria bacterium]
MSTQRVTLSVNGETVSAEVEPRLLLVDFLREHAGTRGVRIGCEEGACGACTVELDGRTVKSCLCLAVRADGATVRTVEGLAQGRHLSALQEAFTSSHALQCGYCTAGMLMSAEAFLAAHGDADFDDDDVRRALTGNYCRCTGYEPIIHAVKVAAGRAAPRAVPESQQSADGGWIGKPVPRREDRRLVAGRGRYADTVGGPGDLHACATRATRAHARIVSIDTTRARAMPGVRLVITGEEARAHWQPIAPTMDLLDLKLPRRYPLATDKVIFYGEPVVLVVADTPWQAEDAARAVEVEYADLPANVDAVSATTASGAALLYPEWGSNLQVEFATSHGDVDGAFARADLVVDEHIGAHRSSAMPLETRVVHAHYDPAEERLTVHTSTQIPHLSRLMLARVFGIPEPRIRVVVGDVGGAFGAKLSVDCEFLPVLGSILTGRPVRWFEARSEWIHSGFAARDYHTRSRAAFARDGTLLALETDILADVGCDGAERACGLGMPINGGTYAPGPYRCPVYRTRVRCVVTNKAPYNAFRGYGKDLANLLIERVLDQAADRLEMDPVRLRQRNLLEHYPHQLVTGPILENGTAAESMAELERLMDVPALRAEQARLLGEGRYLGISLVPYIEPAGATFPGSLCQNFESVAMRITADGGVQVLTGVQNIGQGIETSYAQVAADILGARLADVSIQWGDTTAVPYGSGTYASRGAMYAVGAMLDAGDKLRKRIVTGAATLFGCSADDIAIANGVITCTADGRTMSFAEFAYACYFQPGAEVVLDRADAPLLEAQGQYRHPQVNWKPDALGRVQFYPTHANGAEGALVEVDAETGRVEVKKIWMVADHGVVLNELLLKGQVRGGVVQQLGGTLYENLAYDADGIPLQKTLKEYGMPTVWAAPEIEIHHLVSPSPATRIGAKGGGEDGCIATTTALMGAVEDALRPLGVKVMSGPLSPARVRGMIEAAQAAAGDVPRRSST